MGERPWTYLGVAGAWRDGVVGPGGPSMVVGTPRAVGCEKRSNPGNGVMAEGSHGNKQGPMFVVGCAARLLLDVSPVTHPAAALRWPYCGQ